MRFKRPSLAEQFQLELEPEVRLLLLDFDSASPRFRLPPPLLTCLGRTPAENTAVGGVPTSLHLWEVDANGVRRARAADLSIRPYDEAQVELAFMWLRGAVAQRGGRRRWELLLHSAKDEKPDHFHIARKRVP